MDFDLTSCIQGEPEAWNRFCSETAGIILAAIRRTAGPQLQDPNLPDSDDLLQAVYLRLVKDDFKLLKSFDSKKASLVTWLTLVSRSTTIDALRRKRLPTIPLQASDSSSNPATEDCDAPTNPSADFDQVAPMHLLTTRQKLVLTLLFEDDRTVPEVARILGVGEQTIRSTKHKALERLRKHFNAGKTIDEA